ncbi:hypothetical protein [Amycolatopsis sp. WQ 127309]|uniref:hypothetical protein n=1 Tax=Amycolatopsis sp. WQ 127309 TaxID=2932773 RepID=UPI001FF1C018|nr:hypothetical protein [Amycolatopsis sp. WQ 127309]UOZ07639.1 hypothetical protein MUY22_04915 [Amycolatopsis sp. WQ 127309]
MPENLSTTLGALVEAQVTDTGRAPSPVLVLEGTGGSGRSTALRKTLEEYREKTPTALVQPHDNGEPADSAVRGVLTAVMLGLTPGIRGYDVKFPRTVIAQIVLSEDFSGLTAAAALSRLKVVLAAYSEPAAVTKFVVGLVAAGGELAANQAAPPVAAVTSAIAKQVAAGVLAALRKRAWQRQIDWDGLVAWFGHQDKGFRYNAAQILIDLSNRARSDRADLREGVTDLLVAALLADLRHSWESARGTAPNALVLIDDADLPGPSAFIGSLIRVRAGLAATRAGLPDPVNVAVASAGALADVLTADTGWAGGADPARPWVRVPAADLGEEEVCLLAQSFDWGGGRRYGLITHHLTHGHPEGTGIVLRALVAAPELADDLDGLLRRRGPGDVPIEHRLLEPFARGLSARKDVDEPQFEALVTLSGARDRHEAEGLLPLLPHPIGIGSPVFTSPTLWSPPGADGGRLHPLARYVGLRLLAARDDPATGWTAVFRKLRDRAGPDDRAGRLHHERLLSGKEVVAKELAGLLRELRAADWLTLLDEVTATPDPRERDFAAVCGPKQPATPVDHIVVLLGVFPALHDPCLTSAWNRTTLQTLASHSLTHLAGYGDERPPFLMWPRR